MKFNKTFYQIDRSTFYDMYSKISIQLWNAKILSLLYSWNSILGFFTTTLQFPNRMADGKGNREENVNEQQQKTKSNRYFITDLIQVPMRLFYLNKRLRLVHKVKSVWCAFYNKKILLLLWSTETL